MVLLTRAVAVFGVNAALGLAASAATVGTTASAHAAQLTFAWLIPMTAICAVALAVAVATRSANTGAAAGVAAWVIVVLGWSAASGAPGAPGVRLTAAVTDPSLYLPYLAVAACCAAIVGYATRPQRGMQ
jgi:hypothetical protein